MCPLVIGIGRSMLQDAEERWGGPQAVPTTTWGAVGLMLAHCALGVIYIPLAPMSAIMVLEGVMLGGRVGLQLELGLKKVFAVTAHYKFELSLAGSRRHNKKLSQYLFLFHPDQEG